jgi:hypothetical protein
MQDRAKPIDWLMEMFGSGHTDVIVLRRIIGFPAADPDISAGSADQRVCAGYDERLVPCRDLRRSRILQPLALVEVEDGKALEKCNLARLAIRPGRDSVAFPRREPVGITDGRALLPLAHVSAQCLRLPVG